MIFVSHLQLLMKNTHAQDNNKFDEYFLQQVSFTQVNEGHMHHIFVLCFSSFYATKGGNHAQRGFEPRTQKVEYSA